MYKAPASGLPAAVVIGLDSITGLQTARVLAGRSIPVVGVARNERHPACRTRACARVLGVGEREEDLVQLLLRHSADFAEAPVLFPCTDASVLAVARSHAALAPGYRSVLPAAPVVESLLDKAAFLTCAMAADVPVATTFVIRQSADATEAARVVAFPCVLKPAVKTAAWLAHTKAKVFRADDPAQLLALYERCRAWADVFVVQEWIPGPDALHVTCNAYFGAHSRMMASFVSRKLRQWPLEGGVGCLSEATTNEEVTALTERLFKRAGHRGLAYLEAKLDERTGRFVAIEPNVGRPTGRSAAADRFGVPLLYTQYCDALGWPLPRAAAQPPSGAKWIYFRQDCQSALAHWRAGRLTMRQWVRSLQGVGADAVFSWRDPVPFLADLLVGVRKAAAAPAETMSPMPAAPAPASRKRVPASSPSRPAATLSVADFDVHGIVGVRLVDATSEDLAAVVRQLGPLSSELRRRPDVVVRFVDHLPVRDLRWIEYGRTGFNDDGFHLLQGSGKHPVRVRICMDRVGDRCDIVCQRGLKSIPLLMAVVVATAAARGWVPLHASGFVHNGRGVLVTGWAKGGKTEALLAFANRGAAYVGDEWILLSPDGRRMCGVPESIRLQDWHLDSLANVRQRVSRRQLMAFSGVRHLDRLHHRLAATPFGRLAPMRLVGRALPALRRQLNVQMDPLTVFRRTANAFEADVHTVCLMVSHESPEITIEPADPREVAGRIAASVRYEQLPLTSTYHAFRFAFPERSSPWLDSGDPDHADRLARALSTKRTYVVRHPYPCSLHGLYEAMSPLVSGSEGAMVPDSGGMTLLGKRIHA